MVAPVSHPSLGPFVLGVNNRRPEYELRTKDGSFLRAAANVDISDPGTLKRRSGYARVVEGADCHSFWSDEEVAYFVDGTDLKKVVGLDTTPVVTTIRSGMTRGHAVSYTAVGDSVYWTNGMETGRIDSTGAHALGCPGLPATPAVSATSGGSVPKGSYQLSFGFVNAQGEQSGATEPASCTLTTQGTIVVSGMPSAFPAGVTGLMVFATPPDGDVLMHVVTLSAAQTTLSISAPMVYGARCMTLMLTPMPAGQIVRELNGRLFVANGNALYFSEPYNYALTNPERNYVIFHEPVTVVEPMSAGMYVVSDQVYWVRGDIANAELDPVLPYGGVLGSSGHIRHENKCWWASPRGLVIGDANGQVRNVQEDNVAIDKAAYGAALFRETDGLKQVLTSLFGTEGSGAAARSYMDAEIVRKGTTL